MTKLSVRGPFTNSTSTEIDCGMDTRLHNIVSASGAYKHFKCAPFAAKFSEVTTSGTCEVCCYSCCSCCTGAGSHTSAECLILRWSGVITRAGEEVSRVQQNCGVGPRGRSSLNDPATTCFITFDIELSHPSLAPAHRDG